MSEQGIMEARANVVELFEELLTFEQTLIKGLNRAREMRLRERECYHDLSQAQPDLYPGIGNSLLCHGMKLLSPWMGRMAGFAVARDRGPAGGGCARSVLCLGRAARQLEPS